MTHRTFETGATRDVEDGKPDPESFVSPLVLRRFFEYMHGKRAMPDGSVRDSDNWQKGIPLDAYAKSFMRHAHDLHLHHRGLGHMARESLEDTLCALLFNAQGYLFETLRARERERERERAREWEAADVAERMREATARVDKRAPR